MGDTGGCFEITGVCSEARLGRFLGKIETPALLMHTRRGFPSPFTLQDLDNLGASNSSLLQVSVSDFVDGPGEKVFATFSGGLKGFSGMEGREEMVLVTLRDGMDGQSGMPASDTWVTVQSPGGQKKLEFQRYIALLNAMRPDAAECLCDEVRNEVSNKRAKKSVDRCIDWMDQCIKAKKEGKLPAMMQLFGTVTGSSFERERQRSAEEAAKREVDGFSICGLGTGETRQERADLLSAVLKALPASKPRFIHGLGNPDEILACVEAGIDLFESAYPAFVSASGAAITYPVSFEEVMADHTHTARSEGEGEEHGEGFSGKLNLRDNGLRRDTSPILKGCECFSCRRHTRAYIHHLINTHEILGDVLLHIHNHHHYTRFFAGIRASIAAGKLHEYASQFRLKRKHAC